MAINWNLKVALVRKFGSQISTATQIGIAENRLSYIVRGHIQPSDREWKALALALGPARAKRLLKNDSKREPVHHDLVRV